MQQETIYYNQMVKKCRKEWEEISKLSRELNPSQDTVTKLTVAKQTLMLVLSADFQQSKLIPHWDKTEQPGTTYYLQKVSHEIFGLLDHRSEESNFIWVFNETVGPKNTDHTKTFLSQYLEKVTTDFPLIRCACIFLDNAVNTNKNRYLFSWAMGPLGLGTCRHAHFGPLPIQLLVGGHTNFAPDCLFSLTGNAYNKADV